MNAFLTRNWRGLLMVLLGGATLVAAHYLLDVCADAGKFLTMPNGAQVNMACSWSERAVEGIAGLVMLIGVVMLWMKESARALSLATALAGVLMVLIPWVIIPTCKSAMMPCNMSFRPGVTLLGGLITLAGLAGAAQFHFTRVGAPERHA